MLIQNAELEGRRTDLRISDCIVEIGDSLAPGDDDIINANGCAVLPGLHDHHIHLYAASAAASSVDCNALGSDNAEGLQELLEDVAGTGWVRGVGYHESTAGELNRSTLDELYAHRPLRLQHSSGKLWILNSLAVEQLGLEKVRGQPGIERDTNGQITGRVFRMDAWLQHALGKIDWPDLSAVSAELASLGVTGVTDASYTNSPVTAEQFASAQSRGELLQRLYLMGDESLSSGPLKIMLDEDELPEVAVLTERVRRAHEAGRGAAFHCVSHVELLVALAALADAGSHAEDRIEHAAVVRADMLPRLVDSGCTVVTQPGFIADRGERYRRDADRADLPFLYPYASLQAAGIPVAASSDAPYGPRDPWRVMAAAVARCTETGQPLGAAECVTAQEALRGYLSVPQEPGGAARRLVVGAQADLCILSSCLGQALENLCGVRVQQTFVAGRSIYNKEPNTSSLCSPR